MDLAKSSVLYHDTIETIEILLDEFDRLFPLLYPVSTSLCLCAYQREKLTMYMIVPYCILQDLELIKQIYEVLILVRITRKI